MIKDIAVHLDGSDEDETRLAQAEMLATLTDAHLRGIYIHELPEVIAISDPSGSAYLQQLMVDATAKAERDLARLKPRFAELELPNDLASIQSFPPNAGADLAAEARTADLLVMSRPARGGPARRSLQESVLFSSGRGCLFVPPGVRPRNPDTVLVAWKNTREAARAVAEALPLLRHASQVIVAIVEEVEASEQFGEARGTQIGRHLSRHGVAAEIRPVSGWANAGEALLNEARRSGADLMVMGGYGHARFREWMLGGVTRSLLSDADVPVLAAH